MDIEIDWLVSNINVEVGQAAPWLLNKQCSMTERSLGGNK